MGDVRYDHPCLLVFISTCNAHCAGSKVLRTSPRPGSRERLTDDLDRAAGIETTLRGAGRIRLLIVEGGCPGAVRVGSGSDLIAFVAIRVLQVSRRAQTLSIDD